MSQDFDGTQPSLALNAFAFSTSAGPINCTQTFPRYVFHATEKPRTVSSEAEFQALGEGWSYEYQKQDYPKIKFGPNGEVTSVENPEEEGKLEGSWSDTPPEPKAGQKHPKRADQRTLQELGEAIRDSRRLALDYGQLNQDLDLKADNVATREISAQELPHPVVHPVETPEQRRRREEQQDKTTQQKREEDEGNKRPKR